MGRRLADLLHGRRGCSSALLLAGAARLAGGRLPRLAGRAVRRRVLARSTTFTRQDRPRLQHSTTSRRCRTSDVYRTIVLRTVGDRRGGDGHRRAARVPDRVLHGARSRRRACAALLVVAVLMPLWASYLVKVYAWRTILAEDGILNWVLDPFGLSGPGFGNVAHLARLHLPLAAVHDPADLRGPRADPELAARRVGRPRRARRGGRSGAWSCRWRFPAVVAGSIFTFSLTLGDYITPQLVSQHAVHRQRRLRERRRGEQPAARRRVRDGAGRRSWSSTCWSRGGSAPSSTSDACISSRHTLVPAHRHRRHARVPLLRRCVVIALYAFNTRRDRRRGRSTGFTLDWFEQGVAQPRARATRCWTSVKAALGATRDRAGARHARRASPSRATGSSAARRSRSWSILPIALPGIVTGMALNSTFTQVARASTSALFTVDRRPRHVLHRRRLQQRRRAAAAHVARHFEEASARPRRRHAGRRSATSRSRSCARALIAGALLAFALSFDEVIVTTFTAGDQRDAADLDPQQPLAARNSCRSSTSSRVARDPAVDHPRLPRPAAHGRPAGRLGGVRAGRRRRRGALAPHGARRARRRARGRARPRAGRARGSRRRSPRRRARRGGASRRSRC